MKHPGTSALALAARTATDLPQDKFAALIGTSKRALADWELGIKPPTGSTVTLLALIRDGVVKAKHLRAIAL